MEEREEHITHVTKPGDNIFEDLGFGREEAANLQVRFQLMMRLTDYIEESGMTQDEAADFIGVTQPHISDLTRGKTGNFSIDAQMNMLATAGLRVQMNFEKAA